MDVAGLQVFVTVASERSFSKAAAKLHRTQSAISQAVRRLEEHLGERLFDRSSRDGALTEAGAVLLDHARRTLSLMEEAETAVRELSTLRRGRVRFGANEATVHALLPIVARFREAHPGVEIEVRRVPSRRVAQDVLQQTLDFGVLTFTPTERGVLALTIGADELVMLVPPAHPLAARTSITMIELGRQAVIAHNDPSPARERVLRRFEQRHATLNIQISLPSLDAIKRAVEMGLGVALLPRRCAITELASGQLVGVRVPQLSKPRPVRLIFARHAQRSPAAAAFLAIAGAASHEERQTAARRPPKAGLRTRRDV